MTGNTHVQEFIAENYHATWNEFLTNKRDSADRRAKVGLQRVAQLKKTVAEDSDLMADLLITEADMLYIRGACAGDDPALLRQALAVYDEFLKLVPESKSAARMKAETLLRLHDYEQAWMEFDTVAALASKEPLEELEVAPFRLRFDAAHMERLVADGLVDPSYAAVAADFRTVAEAMDAGNFEPEWADGVSERLKRTVVGNLPPEMIERLRGRYNQPIEFLPGAQVDLTARQAAWADRNPLNPALDWTEIRERYLSERMAIVDDLFSAEAWQELWHYVQTQANFRTMRAGFLGAFPGDGTTHPVIRRLAECLEKAMPDVFAGHPLGLWWFFRYTDQAPRGIGIHADPAAVNINVWLTPDEACIHGGGLKVFKCVPPAERRVDEINHEFASPQEEAAFYEELAKDGEVHIPYKCNRALLFISDQYHVSEPFEFKEGMENHRVNLTLLFGDRVADAKAEQKKEDDEWALFA